MLVLNITYDTDNGAISGLPDTLDIPDTVQLDCVADFISDITGWCVLGFDLKRN